MSASHSAWACGACLLWSTAFPAAKIALASMPPITLAGMRFTLAGMLLMPLCGSPAKLLGSVRRAWPIVLGVSLFQTFLLYGTFFAGLARVGGAQGAIVIGSAPLVAALLAHCLMHDDRMNWGKTASIVLGMAGVAVLALASNPWTPTGRGELVGIALLLAGVISSGLAGIVVSRTRGAIHPMHLNATQMLMGGLVLLACGLTTERLPAHWPTPSFFAAWTWLAVISATGFTIWFTLLQRVKVSQVNMWKFLIPAFGATLSWLILPGESPTAATVVGSVCVAAALLLSNRLNARKPAIAPEVAPGPHNGETPTE